MKRMIMIVLTATVFVACNNDKSSTDSKKDSGSSMMNEAMKTDSAATAVPATPVPSMTEGDMMMKGGKMMIMRSGQWAEITETVTNANGDKVMVNGDMIMKSGMKMHFSEGEALKTNGQILDKDGKVMDM